MSDVLDPPAEAIERAQTEGLKEGVFAGLTSGLASGLIGAKVFKFNRNQTIVSIVASSILSGYYFTQAFRSTNMRSLEAEFARTQAETKAGVDYSKASGTSDETVEQ